MKERPPRSATRVYVGFWLRLWASVIDTVAVSFVLVPILWAVYGREYFEANTGTRGLLDILLSWVLPAVVIVLFWIYRSATPGKMAISARIVDARTGGRPSAGQCLVRYLGYYVSILGLGVGFLWIAFDRHKQGWHDKLARTVVIRSHPDHDADEDTARAPDRRAAVSRSHR